MDMNFYSDEEVEEGKENEQQTQKESSVDQSTNNEDNKANVVQSSVDQSNLNSCQDPNLSSTIIDAPKSTSEIMDQKPYSSEILNNNQDGNEKAKDNEVDSDGDDDNGDCQAQEILNSEQMNSNNAQLSENSTQVTNKNVFFEENKMIEKQSEQIELLEKEKSSLMQQKAELEMKNQELEENNLVQEGVLKSKDDKIMEQDNWLKEKDSKLIQFEEEKKELLTKIKNLEIYCSNIQNIYEQTAIQYQKVSLSYNEICLQNKKLSDDIEEYKNQIEDSNRIKQAQQNEEEKRFDRKQCALQLFQLSQQSLECSQFAKIIQQGPIESNKIQLILRSTYTNYNQRSNSNGLMSILDFRKDNTLQNPASKIDQLKESLTKSYFKKQHQEQQPVAINHINSQQPTNPYSTNQPAPQPQQLGQLDYENFIINENPLDEVRRLIEKYYKREKVNYYNIPQTIADVVGGSDGEYKADYSKQQYLINEFNSRQITHVGKVRGDGNCFFRSFIIVFLKLKIAQTQYDHNKLAQFFDDLLRINILEPLNVQSVLEGIKKANSKTLVTFARITLKTKFDEILDTNNQSSTPLAKFVGMLNDDQFDFSLQILCKSLLIFGYLSSPFLKLIEDEQTTKNDILDLNIEGGSETQFLTIQSIINSNLSIFKIQKGDNLSQEDNNRWVFYQQKDWIEKNQSDLGSLQQTEPFNLDRIDENTFQTVYLWFKTGHYYYLLTEQQMYQLDQCLRTCNQQTSSLHLQQNIQYQGELRNHQYPLHSGNQGGNPLQNQQQLNGSNNNKNFSNNYNQPQQFDFMAGNNFDQQMNQPQMMNYNQNQFNQNDQISFKNQTGGFLNNKNSLGDNSGRNSLHQTAEQQQPMNTFNQQNVNQYNQEQQQQQNYQQMLQNQQQAPKSNNYKVQPGQMWENTGNNENSQNQIQQDINQQIYQQQIQHQQAPKSSNYNSQGGQQVMNGQLLQQPAHRSNNYTAQFNQQNNNQPMPVGNMNNNYNNQAAQFDQQNNNQSMAVGNMNYNQTAQFHQENNNYSNNENMNYNNQNGFNQNPQMMNQNGFNQNPQMMNQNGFQQPFSFQNINQGNINENINNNYNQFNQYNNQGQFNQQNQDQYNQQFQGQFNNQNQDQLNQQGQQQQFYPQQQYFQNQNQYNQYQQQLQQQQYQQMLQGNQQQQIQQQVKVSQVFDFQQNPNNQVQFKNTIQQNENFTSQKYNFQQNYPQ